MPIFGMEAYGTVKITGQSLQMIHKALGEGQDPLNQRGTEGWKMTHVSVILNNNFIVRIESGKVA